MRFEELDNALNKLIVTIEKEPQALLHYAATQAEEIIKDRIFDEGETATGQSFGRYRSSWKKQRKKKGRQVAYKDLDMTGGLRKSIKVFSGKKKAGLRFNNDKARLIAEGQEEQIGRGRIFVLSEKEADEVVRRTAEYGIRELQKAIKQIFR